IIHMAYLITESESNPYLANQVNVGGTVNVLEAARLTDVKRVAFTSSKGVYGEITGEHGYPKYKPIDEDYPKNPDRVYGVTKLACEGFGEQYVRAYGLSFVALRFANTFGPGKSVERHATYAAVGSMLEQALIGKPVKVPRGGDSRDDLLYYKDVAKSVVLACQAEGVRHRAFNIGMGKPFALRDVADVVRRIIPDAKIEIGDGLDYKYGGERPYSGYCVFDCKRAEEELGFTPDYGLETGMRDYAAELKRLNML
ncbi:MAG: NAD-dependent epimerase/dehydratase family protein, partial [Thaumarchaeota archaeon]|nr:NAD-dependent epimerase/dehydratase family protein [Nitrososphaerota archaeon]